MIDIHDGASVRNLERIKESGGTGGRAPVGRGTTFALVVTSCACVLFASLAFGARRTSTPPTHKVDPLGDLVTRAPVATIQAGEVTFPGILSDKTNPATALAAATAGGTTPTAIPPPPQATDRLPVVPLPARHALPTPTLAGGIAQSAKPKDRLTALAESATDPISSATPLAGAGSEGGWQVQVSSFRTEPEADVFVKQLRVRGHKAHVQVANIPSRGTWYRVKIGPFSTQLEATKYRASFEAREKIPGFVVKSGEMH